MLFVRPTLILVFDRLSDELFCVAPVWPAGRARRRWPSPQANGSTRRCAASPPRAPPAAARDDLPEPAPNPVCRRGATATWSRPKDYIEAGDIFQVVLAQRFTAPFTAAAAGALPRAAPGQPLALPLFPRPAGLCADRLKPGNPGAGARWRSDHPAHRRHPPAREHARGRPRQRGACSPIPRNAPNT
jgi:hypothetical protein